MEATRVERESWRGTLPLHSTGNRSAAGYERNWKRPCASRSKTNHHSSWLASRPAWQFSSFGFHSPGGRPPRAVIRRRLCPVISLNAVSRLMQPPDRDRVGPAPVWPIYFNQLSNGRDAAAPPAERDAKSFSSQSAFSDAAHRRRED